MRVREQCNGDIPACQPFAHDAGANHSSNQERAAHELSRQSCAQVEISLTPDLIDLFLDCQLIDGRQGEAKEETDPSL